MHELVGTFPLLLGTFRTGNKYSRERELNKFTRLHTKEDGKIKFRHLRL